MLARSSALTCTACAVTCAPRMRARTPFCMSATPTEAPIAAEAPCVVEMPSAPVAVTMRLLSWAETETRPASARSCVPAAAPLLSMTACTSVRDRFTPMAPAPPRDLPPAPATVMLSMLLVRPWPCVSAPMSSEIMPPPLSSLSTTLRSVTPPEPLVAPSWMAMPSLAFCSEVAS